MITEKRKKIILASIFLISLTLLILSFIVKKDKANNQITNNPATTQTKIQNINKTVITKEDADKIKKALEDAKKEMKELQNEVDDKKIVLTDKNSLILWNGNYKVFNFYLKNISKIKNPSNLKYIEYKIKNNDKIVNLDEIKDSDIKSEIYNCTINKEERFIICTAKGKITKDLIEKNKLGDNLYLFSIKKIQKQNNNQDPAAK